MKSTIGNRNHRRPRVLALLTTTLLLVHQIDAAFWHEWEMFRLPGGNQLNLLLNLPIVALVIYAYGCIASEAANSAMCQKLIALLGFITVAIHAGFFFAGRSEFAQPVSVGLLLGIGVLSVFQLVVLRMRQR